MQTRRKCVQLLDLRDELLLRILDLFARGERDCGMRFGAVLLINKYLRGLFRPPLVKLREEWVRAFIFYKYFL